MTTTEQKARLFAPELEIHDSNDSEYATGDKVEIDVSLIPAHVVESLIAPLPELLDDFYSKPGAEEKFQKWLAERKAKQSVKES